MRADFSCWFSGLLYACAVSALTLSGCGGSAPTLSGLPESEPAASVQPRDGLMTGVAGRWHVGLDPGALAATATFEAPRAAAANDDLYLLPITNFLKADSLRITGVRTTATTLDLSYLVTHPFSGPTDPTAPATAGNRADLGISGIALFLMDVPTATGNSWFGSDLGGPTIANATLVTNADAYWRPRAMVATSGLANTFPYRLLVDELAGGTGSRVGISNGGVVTGNFGSDGWTRAELGAAAPFNNWTGYGVLHQGQAAANTVSLDLAVLAGMPAVAFDVVIIAKYNDPRGGATPTKKRANRLPPATPDAADFAYRMPHGAWDIQAIRFTGAGGPGYVTDEVSSATLGFHVEDWDARATGSTFASLADDPDVTRVRESSAGMPGFSVCIPGVLGDENTVVTFDPATMVVDDDTAVGGDPGVDSGAPGDALFLTEEVFKPAGSGEVAGTYIGMARAGDPQLGTTITPLAADLSLITTNPPGGDVYQVFPVTMTAPTLPEVGWARLLDPGMDKWLEATGVAIDHESSVLVVGFFWQTIDFGGGLRTSIGGMDNFVVKFDRTGQYLWDYTWGSDSDENYRHVRADPAGGVYIGGSFDGTTDFDGTGPLAPIANNVREDAFIMRLSSAGAFEWVRIFGALAGTKEAEVAKSMTADASGVYLGGFYRSQGLKFHASDPAFWGASIAGAFIVKLLPNGDFAWSQCFDGGDHDEFRGIASDGGSGLLGIIDFYSTSIDFGGGVRNNTDTGGTTDDMALIRLNAATGAYVADNHFPGSDIEQPQALAANGNFVAVTGHTWSLDLDLGGGVLPHFGGSDFYWGRFDATTLAHQWSGALGSESYDPGFGVGVDPSGAVYVAGLFQGPIDFGFGILTPVMQDGFLYKLDPAGNPAWVHTWGGAVDFVRGTSVACDAVSVAVVGVTGVGGPLDYEPGAPVFELTSEGISGVVIRDLAAGTW